MIRRGRAEGWLNHPISQLRKWAEFSGGKFNGVEVTVRAGYEARGSSIVATRDLNDNEEHPLILVPPELVLCLESVHQHAKVDSHLKEVLDAVGDYGKVR